MSVVSAGKFGTPFHGEISDDGAGLVVHLPNDSTMPYPLSISSTYTPVKLQALDAPAAPSTTASEAAEGKLWRNFILYQYRQTDLYHNNVITAGSSSEEILAEWFYMPTFGKRFTLRLVGPGPGYVASSRTYTVGVVGGSEIHTLTLTGQKLTFADVCDGDGSKALLILTKPGDASILDEVREWVLSYDEETGDISLVESVLDSSINTESSSTGSATIPRQALRIVETSTWIENHGGIDYTFHTYEGESFTTAGNETYTSGSSTFNHLNGTASGSFVHLIAAMYIDGEACIITHEAAWSRSQTWTINLDYTYASHDEWSEALNQVVNVVDTPGAVHDSIAYAASNTITTSIKINGVSAIEIASAGTLAGSYEQDGTGTYPSNENPLRSSRWTYELNLITGQMDNVGRPGVLTDALNSEVITGQSMYPDSRVARSTEISPYIERTLHPVIREEVTGGVIHPGGTGTFAGEYANYNPVTQEVGGGSQNLSWV